MLRTILAFLAALVLAVVLGTAAHSSFIMHDWAATAAQAGVPADLTVADRAAWFAEDLKGMSPIYALLVGIALFIAFIAAGLFARLTGLRGIVFTVAGGVAVFALFTIMKQVLGTVGVFGARGDMGLAAQVAVGAVAGLVFAALKPAVR